VVQPRELTGFHISGVRSDNGRVNRARAAALVALLALAACSKAPPPTPPPLTFAPTPVPSIAPAAPSHGPILGHGTYVATADGRMVDVWKKPGDATAPSFREWGVNPVGERIRFLVTDAKRDDQGNAWLHVLLPVRPNEADGWVLENDVKLQPIHQKIVVDLSSRTLERFKGSRLLEKFRVGIGQPQWPTATGTFYVWAQVPQASPFGPYGVFALGLSGFSEVLKNWPGGGRMAIHGTANPSDQGQMVSHGCIRVYNPNMMQLKHVPLGTPVIIQQ
jgi:lipoprotein-anchoring transpeptidase ErfK/SrfK